MALLALPMALSAAPYRKETQAELATLEVFNKAWAGDEASFKKLRELADAGDALAQNAIGNFYAEGKFVGKDEAVALQWWTKAAELGVPVAQYNVAQAHLRALDDVSDLVEINKWLEKASEQNFMPAQCDYAVGFTMEGQAWFDLVKAYKWYTICASHALAQGPNGEDDRYAAFAYHALYKLKDKMTPEQVAEGEAQARAWLDEFGLPREREAKDLAAFMERQKALQLQEKK